MRLPEPDAAGPCGHRTGLSPLRRGVSGPGEDRTGELILKKMSLGRLFIFLGILFFIAGVLMLTGSKIPGLKNLGHLPGDIAVEKEGFRFYFPIVTCLVVSAVLTLIFQLIHFLKNR